MKKIIFILFFSGAFYFKSNGQKMTPEEYIQQYKEMAIREMKRMGVPAAITLAQGLLETENGNSDLLKRSNNHFGIKCKSSWTAESVTHDDDEAGECFRMYKNAEESYRDHSNFLRSSDRYSFLFKLDPTDYKAWAYGLRKAGYATNPKYPEILIKNIEQNNLEQYTDIAINDVPHFDGSKYKADEEKPAMVTLVSEEETFEPSAVTINGLKALFVPKGTSLLAIATDNKINLSKLLEINDLEKDGLLQKDQFVFLQKKAKEGNRNFCIAEPGETMYDIAQKNGIIYKNLLEYNLISGNGNLQPGSKIYLKPQPVVAVQKEEIQEKYPVSLTEKNRTDIVSNIHEVLPKEGLYSISKKYGVSVQQLKLWNNLQNDNLRIGQQLIISK